MKGGRARTQACVHPTSSGEEEEEKKGGRVLRIPESQVTKQADGGGRVRDRQTDGKQAEGGGEAACSSAPVL